MSQTQGEQAGGGLRGGRPNGLKSRDDEGERAGEPRQGPDDPGTDRLDDARAAARRTRGWCYADFSARTGLRGTMVGAAFAITDCFVTMTRATSSVDGTSNMIGPSTSSMIARSPRAPV